MEDFYYYSVQRRVNPTEETSTIFREREEAQAYLDKLFKPNDYMIRNIKYNANENSDLDQRYSLAETILEDAIMFIIRRSDELTEIANEIVEFKNDIKRRLDKIRLK